VASFLLAVCSRRQRYRHGARRPTHAG